MSTHQYITQRIAKTKAGKMLFPADFRGLGADSAIKMSLSRIAQTGTIIRVSHGIYIKAKRSGEKQGLLLAAEDIALAIANKEKIRIKPAGEYVLFSLGFTQEKPLVLTYVTDGEPRRIAVGDMTIVFKATTPKKLSMKGKVSSLLIQALEEIGEKKIDEQMLGLVKNSIQKEEPRLLEEDMKKAPAWIYNFLYKIKLSN